MDDREKRREEEVQKLENGRRFFSKIENIFHDFFSAFLGEIYKNREYKL